MPQVSPIEIEFRKDRVRKIYHKVGARPEIQKEKFLREVKAYQLFSTLQVQFVPRLLDFHDEELWIETSWAGRTLVDWLEHSPSNKLDQVISQLIDIDAFLSLKRINYLESSPRDVLVNEKGHVSIIDFEYTFLNERFQQVLLEKMFHERMHLVENVVQREAFLAMIRMRLKECHCYLSRKIMNSILGRLGLLRPSWLVTQ